jgi:hypothetical protein
VSGPGESRYRIIKSSEGLTPKSISPLGGVGCGEQVPNESSAFLVRATLELGGVPTMYQCLLEGNHLSAQIVRFTTLSATSRVDGRQGMTFDDLFKPLDRTFELCKTRRLRPATAAV